MKGQKNMIFSLDTDRAFDTIQHLIKTETLKPGIVGILETYSIGFDSAPHGRSQPGQ